MTRSYEAVICGAGICGVSAAYFLARQGLKDILLVDEGEPLGLTSSHSTECYRNWWPDPEMLALMNRSIDLMDELADASGNAFKLNRRGYLYVTGDSNKLPAMTEKARRISALGAGPLRIHSLNGSTYQPCELEGYKDSPPGADLLVGADLIRVHFPCLTEQAAVALHVRRAGWLDSVGLGNFLLEQAKQRGVKVECARMSGLDVANDAVTGVRLGNGETLQTSIFINAAGPMIREIGQLMGVDVPVFTELHMKVAFRDTLGAIDRASPLLIWDDPQTLEWSDEEREYLAAEAETRWMTEQLPAGAHARPDGGPDSPMVLLLWEYTERSMPPTWPLPLDENYPEIALRGMATMAPALKKYLGHLPRPIIDGGYYTKTRENRLLAGPTPLKGAYLIGAVSGYGIMAACGAGELLAAHVTGAELPSYAPAFSLERYEDAGYLKMLESWGESGQL